MTASGVECRLFGGVATQHLPYFSEVDGDGFAGVDDDKVIGIQQLLSGTCNGTSHVFFMCAL